MSEIDNEPLMKSLRLRNTIAESVEGLEESHAVALIKENGFTPRVRRRDRESFAGTCDMSTNRINLCIDNGLVTDATAG